MSRLKDFPRNLTRVCTEAFSLGLTMGLLVKPAARESITEHVGVQEPREPQAMAALVAAWV